MPRPHVPRFARPELLGPSRRARWRRWVLRRAAAAVCAAGAVVVLVGVVRPPPPATTPVLVAAHDLARGAVLDHEDVRLVHVPRDPPPVATTGDPSTLVGRRLSTAVLGGEPLTTTRLVPRTPADDLPAGTVAAHVVVADEHVLDLVSAGHRVTLFAELGGAALARDVLVLGVDTPEPASVTGPLPGADGLPGGLVCALSPADLERVFAGQRPEGGAPRVLPVVTGAAAG
ncbi:SAF domain-containing protein [Knoellia sp. CPCC 206435]|uniref:SAF domain-containing protein n=1 Tax=Knoellia terrae TaxID=3404797 RepID=UPI003B43781D